MIDFTNEDIKEGIGATVFTKNVPSPWVYIKQPLTPQRSSGPKLRRQFRKPEPKTVTVLAIAGEDFSIVASDTRLSEDKTVIGCSGFHGDCLTLTKIIEARLKMYKHSNNKAMTTRAIAAMLSTILYSRRFFPYYVYNIIGGLDEEGKGAVYSFDPVGSYQRDSFQGWRLSQAMRLVKDVFISAAERDVYTGDALKICIVTKEDIREETIPLRKD
ncbi:hypothetical protein FD755_016403 [Muntiacus reevesi]|uniref:Proteasome subunit beta n=1 Tax=Muntiacus reevesi TaxID=9886 RepID=A0A5N3XED3_MUNRE|nr:hypothetical protein FD755_016403 [Muntiacus reevesi]